MQNSNESHIKLVILIIVIIVIAAGLLPACIPFAQLTPTPTPIMLPGFPWPVPKPSAFEVLGNESLGLHTQEEITFHDVDERISRALHLAGYSEKSYFGVPGGFAIVTRLEKMDADGYPDYPDRWASSLAPISFTEFSIEKYLEALFGVPKGHYRVFVFVVSSEPVLQSGTPAAQEEAQTWIVEGANKLSSQMNELPYTQEHSTTAYIYEFIQSGVGGVASYNIPSDFTGRQHLERAGLWENLNNTIVLAPTATRTPIPPKVTLNSIQNGQNVPCGNIASGTYPVELDKAIWPVVYFKGRYYPQDEEGKAAQKVNGTWYQTVRFGDCTNNSDEYTGPDEYTGMRFQLIIFTANESANAAFEAYILNALRTGNWSGMTELPAGIIEQGRVLVIRE